MHIDFLLDVFEENKNNDAVIWQDKKYKYSFFLQKIKFWKKWLKANNVPVGSVVSLEGTFSPDSISMLFALIENESIIVPIYKLNPTKKKKIFETSQTEYAISFDNSGNVQINFLSSKTTNKYYETVKKRKHPGLVLFTSGSSGKPKAAVHDFTALFKKFKKKRNHLRTLNFLLFDHWGGLNTMFHILSNGETIVSTDDRSPENICRLIEKFKIELLPVSPTFLNLMVISESYKKYDLSSIKMITYGTESMPITLLEKLSQIFPHVKLLQTYGLIEVGVLSTWSEKNNSLWMKIGGSDNSIRIRDGILQIKSESAMLGYLNADDPFTQDGWFITGDRVEMKGDYIRILGRDSEIINVGGEKVFPAEVENTIQEMKEVGEVTVYGEKNPIVGNIVCAKIRLVEKIDEKEMIKKIKIHCRENLEKFKVPIKITILNEPQHSYRYKKLKINEFN